MNGYLVTIENVTAGWSFFVLSGVDPDPSDQVVVVDGLTHGWKFADEAVPNPIEPATVQFGLAARSTEALPSAEVGDMVMVTVDLMDVDEDTATDLDARAIEFVGRLSEPIVDLDPSSGWPARLNLVASDLLADANSIFPQSGAWTLNANVGKVPYPYSFLSALVSWRYSADIFYPVGWFDNTAFLQLPYLGDEIRVGPPQASLYEMLNKIGAGTPTLDGSLYFPRYRWDPTKTEPDPTRWRAAGRDTGHPRFATAAGYIYQRFDDLPSGSRLPYTLTGPAAGIVTLALDSDPALMAGIAVIPAGAVHVPTTARRSRDTNVNTYAVNGYASIYENQEQVSTLTPLSNATSISVSTNSAAPSTRAIDTYAELDMAAAAGLDVSFRYNGQTPAERSAAMRQLFERAYRPDDASTSAAWAYDVLRVDARGLSTQEYSAIIPMLNSWAPEQFDGVCVRPVLVHDVEPDVALAPFRNIAGRLVGADLTIAGGHITVDMRLAPGAAPLPPTGFGLSSPAITAAALLAGPYATTPANKFDPKISALDMRYVRP